MATGRERVRDAVSDLMAADFRTDNREVTAFRESAWAKFYALADDADALASARETLARVREAAGPLRVFEQLRGTFIPGAERRLTTDVVKAVPVADEFATCGPERDEFQESWRWGITIGNTRRLLAAISATEPKRGGEG